MKSLMPNKVSNMTDVDLILEHLYGDADDSPLSPELQERFELLSKIDDLRIRHTSKKKVFKIIDKKYPDLKLYARKEQRLWKQAEYIFGSQALRDKDADRHYLALKVERALDKALKMNKYGPAAALARELRALRRLDEKEEDALAGFTPHTVIITADKAVLGEEYSPFSEKDKSALIKQFLGATAEVIEEDTNDSD